MPAPHSICLFGGSFDPVHAGHLHIAAAAHDACQPERILFLPAACSPFKQGKTTLFTNEERLALLQTALRDIPYAAVSDLDLTLPPPSWSWRIVEHFRTLHPTTRLYWLMGTDQWEALHRWARYDYLIANLNFIVYHRGSAPQPRPGVSCHPIIGNHPASSTAIREALLNHLPIDNNILPEDIQKQAKSFLQKRLA